MAEHVKRKHARAKLVKMGYSVGGHLAHKADEAEDKEMVEEGVHEHESHMHKGKKKTKLKLKRGGHVEGEKPKHRADRLARGGKAKGAHGGKGHVTVNVVNAHPGAGAPRPVPVPVPMGAGPGGPPPGMGPGGPPMPPPGLGAGPGGPPPGMNRGGRAKGKKMGDSQRDKKGGMPDGHFRKGGKTKAKFPVPMGAGGGGGLGRLEKAAMQRRQ